MREGARAILRYRREAPKARSVCQLRRAPHCSGCRQTCGTPSLVGLTPRRWARRAREEWSRLEDDARVDLWEWSSHRVGGYRAGGASLLVGHATGLVGAVGACTEAECEEGW